MNRDIAATQMDILSRSRSALDRARAYEQRLGTHLMDLRSRIEAGAARQASVAIGEVSNRTKVADLPALRAEVATVENQHRLAIEALADIDAEHARHEAGLAALFGSTDVARARLRDAHAARATASGAVDSAKAILDRATAHADTLAAKRDAARAVEHDHDQAAMARLHAALQSGEALAETAHPLRRSSAGLEEDLRTARLTIDRLDADQKARLADLGKADDGVNLAVEAVLAAEAEMVAQEVAALRARAAMLTRQVRAYANHTPVRRSGTADVDPANNSARPITPGSLLMVRDPALVAPLRTRQTPAVLQTLQPVASVMFETPALAEAEAWQVFERALVQHADATADFASDPVDAPKTSAAGFPRPVSLSSSRVA